LKPFQPGGGAGVPGGNGVQRSGSSSRSSGSTAAQKAQKVTGAMNTAAKLLGPAGGGGLPNAMVGAGLKQAFKAAGAADAALNGEEPPGDDASSDANATTISAKWTNVSLIKPSALRQTPDFMILSKPVDVEVPSPAAPGLPADQAAAANAVTRSTLRLASTLSAAATAKQRLGAAGAAHNDEWQYRQAQALLYLRRASGEAMLTVARDLAAYRAIAANNPGTAITGAQALDVQQQLTSGLPADVVSVMKRLGMTDASLEKYRQELLAQSAGMSAAVATDALRALEDALKEFGDYWTSLPTISAPWS